MDDTSTTSPTPNTVATAAVSSATEYQSITEETLNAFQGLSTPIWAFAPSSRDVFWRNGAAFIADALDGPIDDALAADLPDTALDIDGRGVWRRDRDVSERRIYAVSMRRSSIRDDAVAIALIEGDPPARRRANAPSAMDQLRDRVVAQLLDALPLLIFAKDRQGRYAFVNEAFLSYHGRERRDVIGKTARDLFPHDVAENILAADEEAWLRDGLYATETDILVNGVIARQITQKTIIYGRHGDPLLLCAAVDITEQHLTQLRLATLSQHLEEKVSDRTERLEHALNRATAADRAKSRFLATMSHELRTPLNAILGFSQMIGMTAETEPGNAARIAEYAEMIDRSGTHLLSVIEDVLDLSQLEAGRLSIQNDAFSPFELGQQVVSSLASDAMAKGIALSFDKIADDLLLLSDPRRIRQILYNLLGNAVKFTAEGGVVLRCSLSSKADGRATLRFEVEDSGRGIAPEVGDRIFKPFNDVHHRLSSATPGSGLGLSISRHLAELLDGAIGYSSAPGQGSLFWFETTLEVVDSSRITARVR